MSENEEDKQRKKHLAQFELDRTASIFVTQMLRHLAHGSSWIELVRSLQDFYEAMTEVADWVEIGNTIDKQWRISMPEMNADSIDTVKYWRESMIQPALRLAAAQFSHNPIQERRSKDAIMNCVDNIKRIQSGRWMK